MSGFFRKSRIIVGTCSTRPCICRYVFGDVGYGRDVFDEVDLDSRRVWRVRLNVGTCSTRSG